MWILEIRQYAEEDVKETIAIWNSCKRRDRISTERDSYRVDRRSVFKEQTFTGIAYDEEKKKLSECTFCIRIISEDAVTYVMQVMPSEKICGDFISGKCL